MAHCFGRGRGPWCGRPCGDVRMPIHSAAAGRDTWSTAHLHQGTEVGDSVNTLCYYPVAMLLSQKCYCYASHCLNLDFFLNGKNVCSLCFPGVEMEWICVPLVLFCGIHLAFTQFNGFNCDPNYHSRFPGKKSQINNNAFLFKSQ